VLAVPICAAALAAAAVALAAASLAWLAAAAVALSVASTSRAAWGIMRWTTSGSCWMRLGSSRVMFWMRWERSEGAGTPGPGLGSSSAAAGPPTLFAGDSASMLTGADLVAGLVATDLTASALSWRRRTDGVVERARATAS